MGACQRTSGDGTQPAGVHVSASSHCAILLIPVERDCMHWHFILFSSSSSPSSATTIAPSLCLSCGRGGSPLPCEAAFLFCFIFQVRFRLVPLLAGRGVEDVLHGLCVFQQFTLHTVGRCELNTQGAPSPRAMQWPQSCMVGSWILVVAT